MVLSGRVFKKKKCMSCPAFKTNALKNLNKYWTTYHSLKQINSIFMLLILQISASCWLLTLHWSSYQHDQSHTVCTFRHKFIKLAQTQGPRARHIHQLQMYTFLDISTIRSVLVSMNYVHCVAKPIQLGEKVQFIMANYFSEIYTYDSTNLKINRSFLLSICFWFYPLSFLRRS